MWSRQGHTGVRRGLRRWPGRRGPSTAAQSRKWQRGGVQHQWHLDARTSGPSPADEVLDLPEHVAEIPVLEPRTSGSSRTGCFQEVCRAAAPETQNSIEPMFSDAISRRKRAAARRSLAATDMAGLPPVVMLMIASVSAAILEAFQEASGSRWVKPFGGWRGPMQDGGAGPGRVDGGLGDLLQHHREGRQRRWHVDSWSPQALMSFVGTHILVHQVLAVEVAGRGPSRPARRGERGVNIHVGVRRTSPKSANGLMRMVQQGEWVAARSATWPFGGGPVRAGRRSAPR